MYKKLAKLVMYRDEKGDSILSGVSRIIYEYDITAASGITVTCNI